MSQFRFFWEKDSVAAAKTDISMKGGLFVGSEADSFEMLVSSGSLGDVGFGEKAWKEVGWERRIERALSRPRALGAKKE